MAWMEDWKCNYCGEPIGECEPMLVLDGLGYRATTRAAEPDLQYERGMRFHRTCHDDARSALFGTDELNVSEDRPCSEPTS